MFSFVTIYCTGKVISSIHDYNSYPLFLSFLRSLLLYPCDGPISDVLWSMISDGTLNVLKYIYGTEKLEDVTVFKDVYNV